LTVLGRSFLLGLAVGIGVGIYVAPHLAANGVGHMTGLIASSANGQSRDGRVPVEWPTNQNAKKELFRFSNWNYAAYGNDSITNVIRCIQIKQQTIACELSASLSWLNDTKLIEAVFEGKPGNWRMAAAKTR